jgi:AsmA protein
LAGAFAKSSLDFGRKSAAFHLLQLWIDARPCEDSRAHRFAFGGDEIDLAAAKPRQQFCKDRPQSGLNEAMAVMNDTADVQARPAHRITLVQIGWLIGALALSAAVGAVAASFFLTAAVLNSDLAAQIRRTTGFTTSLHGSTRFALLPRPHIDMDAVSFANPQAALRIDAAGFTGYLRLLPLLVGRVEVGHAVLYQPQMVIDVDDRPMTPESTLGRAAGAKSDSPEAAAIDRTQLAIVDLVGGSARLHHKAKPDLYLDDINVTANWRSLDASATLTGQFSFAHVPLQLKAWLAQPVALLRGGASAANLQLESTALHFAATGEVATAPHFQYKGSLIASTDSLRGFAKLTGFSVAKIGRFGELDLRCDAAVTGAIATLANVHLHLDDNDYEGTLAVEANDKTLQLSGTLATNLLDLTAFLDGLPAPSTQERWNDAPLNLTDVGFTDLDLRLSASRLRLNDIEVKDAALSLLTRPGFIDLSLAEATANGGALKGRLTLEGHGNSLDLRASAIGAAINLEPMLQGGPINHPLSGALSGSMTVESKGDSFNALMHGLTGRAQISVANGQLVGVDLAAGLRDSTSKLFAASGDPTQSVTRFDAAQFSAQISQGVAKVADGHIHADSLAVVFGGSADIGERAIDVWAIARPGATEPQSATPTPLTVTVKGPWNNLQITAERAAAGATPVPDQKTSVTPTDH